jgi:hypothetical protein
MYTALRDFEGKGTKIRKRVGYQQQASMRELGAARVSPPEKRQSHYVNNWPIVRV